MRRLRRSVRGPLVAVLALVGFVATGGWLVPGAARASGCTDAWVGPQGATNLSGSWHTAANWSTGAVPTPDDDVCLSAPGSYTVSVTADVAVHSVTVGDGGNAPVLALENHATELTLALGADSTIATGATLQLYTDSPSSSDLVTLASGAILTNAGTLDVAPSGSAEVDGGFDNQGTVIVGGRRFPDQPVSALRLAGPLSNLDGGVLTGGIWDNHGSLRLPTDASITVNAATVTQHLASSICGDATDFCGYTTSGLFQPGVNLGSITLDDGLWHWNSAFENRGAVHVVHGATLSANGGYTQTAPASGPAPLTTVSGDDGSGLNPQASQIDAGAHALVLDAGTLSGDGYVYADDDVINAGAVVRPDPTLHLNSNGAGGYVQRAAGVLDVTLTAPAHATGLDTGPVITLGGTLRITTAAGVTPTPGLAVPIITSWAPYPSGSFTSVTSGSPSPGHTWQVATAPFQAAAPAVPGVSIRSMLAPTLTETLSSSSVAYGSAVRVTGRLTVAGAADANARVTLYRQSIGSATWTAVASGTTGSTGTVAFSAFPSGSCSYRLGAAADGRHVAATSGSLPIAVHTLRLAAGQQVTSPDAGYRLVMQSDGNLVEYGPGNRVVWSSRTNGHRGAYLTMQSDGNAVIYAGGRALWTTRTGGHPRAQMVVQNDGNVVVYSTTRVALWSSGRR